MLRNTPNAETVIVEYGFLDNKNDAKRLKENYKEYADAVIEAVLDYKNINILPDNYYIVKKGDTLWSIANKNNITVSELKALNNLTSNTLSIGQKLKLYDFEEEIDNDVDLSNIYIVKKGDTLYSISNKYGIPINEIKELNNLKSNVLSIGQELFIPDYTLDIDIIDNNNDYDYYTVKNKDTLYGIANKYNITVDELKNINNLNSNILSIGQLLKVPKTEDTIYTVKKGDTLWSIAKENNTTVDNIKLLNNLISNTLTIGQQLLLN